jgi:hypothetical protein
MSERLRLKGFADAVPSEDGLTVTTVVSFENADDQPVDIPFDRLNALIQALLLFHRDSFRNQVASGSIGQELANQTRCL